MKPANVRTDTYKIGHWRYDIVVDYDEKIIDIWFYHKDLGMKTFCIGYELEKDSYELAESYINNYFEFDKRMFWKEFNREF